MYRFKIKNGNFKDEGYTSLFYEDCPNPKCGHKDLRYPRKWSTGANCPTCKTQMPAHLLFKNDYVRKHYFTLLTYTQIGKILLCTE